MRFRHLAIICALANIAIAAAVCPNASGQSLQSPAASQAPLPSVLDNYLTTYVKLTAPQRRQLLSGSPVTALLDANAGQEVGIFGAVWIDAAPASYVARMKDIERFESGGAFRVTKRISNPPRLEDFDALELPADDVADLRRCRISDCEIKLSQPSIDRVRNEINWSRPTAVADATRLARRLAFEYVTGYQQGGNDRLAVYRDSERPTFVASELRSMVDRMPELVEYLPELRTYLLQYPRATLTNSSSFLYWQEAKFGLKPTVRINHVVIQDRPGAVAVASKLIYASHYFWTALEFRVLLSDPARGRGFWFVNVSRSRSDGLTGFTGRLIRGKVENEAQKGILAALQNTKQKLEQRGP